MATMVLGPQGDKDAAGAGAPAVAGPAMSEHDRTERVVECYRTTYQKEKMGPSAGAAFIKVIQTNKIMLTQINQFIFSKEYLQKIGAEFDAGRISGDVASIATISYNPESKGVEVEASKVDHVAHHKILVASITTTWEGVVSEYRGWSKGDRENTILTCLVYSDGYRRPVGQATTVLNIWDWLDTRYLASQMFHFTEENAQILWVDTTYPTVCKCGKCHTYKCTLLNRMINYSTIPITFQCVVFNFSPEAGDSITTRNGTPLPVSQWMMRGVGHNLAFEPARRRPTGRGIFSYRPVAQVPTGKLPLSNQSKPHKLIPILFQLLNQHQHRWQWSPTRPHTPKSPFRQEMVNRQPEAVAEAEVEEDGDAVASKTRTPPFYKQSRPWSPQTAVEGVEEGAEIHKFLSRFEIRNICETTPRSTTIPFYVAPTRSNATNPYKMPTIINEGLEPNQSVLLEHNFLTKWATKECSKLDLSPFVRNIPKASNSCGFDEDALVALGNVAKLLSGVPGSGSIHPNTSLRKCWQLFEIFWAKKTEKGTYNALPSNRRGMCAPGTTANVPRSPKSTQGKKQLSFSVPTT
jgi:hypothetical protein